MRQRCLLRGIVTVCLVLASMVTLTNAAIQPVTSQVFTTATSTQSQTFLTVSFTTSTQPITVYTVQFVNVTRTYTNVVVQFVTVTSYFTRTQVIVSTTRSVIGPQAAPPISLALRPSNSSLPRQTTFESFCRNSTSLWNTPLGLQELLLVRCLV